MLRYVLLMVLIGCALSDGFRRKHPRRREYYQPEADYRDYDDYDYPPSGYGKDSDSGTERPSIFSYWNNLLKRTRLPRFNITNPFTRLFTPYVIKVDFPEGTDPNAADSQANRNRNKNKNEQQEDYIYINPYANSIGAENGQFFYDPVTQQYYEVQETASQDYNPQNNYYATTFNDDDEIVINLGDENKDVTIDDGDEQEEERYVKTTKKVGYMGKYNSPVLRTLKTKRFSIERRASPLKNRKRAKRTRTRKVNRLAVL